LDTIARKDTDVVHAHLPAYVGEHFVAILQINPKHGVWKRLDNSALKNDRIFFRLRQGATS